MLEPISLPAIGKIAPKMPPLCFSRRLLVATGILWSINELMNFLSLTSCLIFWFGSGYRNELLVPHQLFNFLVRKRVPCLHEHLEQIPHPLHLGVVQRVNYSHFLFLVLLGSYHLGEQCCLEELPMFPREDMPRP